MDMKNIKIEKIVLNIGCGTKMPIENAKLVLENLTGLKSVVTVSRKRSTFNVPKNKPIGCKVTVRKNCDEFLRRLLKAKESISQGSFDVTGNFSFGIKEYIDIPNMEYNPKLKLIGMDVCVTLSRPGYRVKRKRLSEKIGKYHVITPKEAMEFVKNNFEILIE
ncbi:MAG: 50S ribosomal protein L5 [Candidatus Aenigmatarchaeota archaeon]